MIRLEDLKIGDKFYGASLDEGIFAECIVTRELLLLDARPEPFEAVICTGGLDFISRKYEELIFRTQEEALEKMNEVRLSLANELVNSDKFIDRLMECATSAKRLTKYDELPIYEIAAKLYKERLVSSASPSCVEKGTLVLTDKGYKKVENIV